MTIKYLLLLFVLLFVTESSIKAQECFCDNELLCKPLSGPIYYTRKEFHGWLVSAESDYATSVAEVPWNKITAIMVDMVDRKFDPRIVCYAHSRGVRVLNFISHYLGDRLAFGNGDSWDVSTQDLYIDFHKKLSNRYFADGINLDIEGFGLINSGARERNFVDWVKRFRDAFPRCLPSDPCNMLTMATPAWPSKFTGQLDKYVDYFMPMAYDLSGPNPLGPNSDTNWVIDSIRKYGKVVDIKKIIIALPWYGYRAQCQPNAPYGLFTDSCVTDKMINTNYNKIYYEYLVGNNYVTSQPLWNGRTQNVYINYLNQTSGRVWQIQYDNPKSLYLKVMGVKDIGGTAVWHLASYYGLPPTVKKELEIGVFPF